MLIFFTTTEGKGLESYTHGDLEHAFQYLLSLFVSRVYACARYTFEMSGSNYKHVNFGFYPHTDVC